MKDQPINKKITRYVRVSTQTSAASSPKDTEIEMQRHIVIVAEQGAGLQINPGLQKLLERVEAGEIKHIFAFSPVRIARDEKLFKKSRG